MSMISELVKELRNKASLLKTSLDEVYIGGDMLNRAADTIEMLSEKARGQAWIPCEERLPEDKCDVLIQFGWNMAVGCINGGDWRINSGDNWCTDVAEDDGKPIAWMPLPVAHTKAVRSGKEHTMTDLIPWEDFIETKGCQFANAEPTQIACPKCGNRIYKRTDIILTCYPPKHQYFCGKCDWVGNA